MIYRRKPVDVEVFAFMVQPQPQWFVDATQAGERHDDGNSTFASFRLKDSKRLLKMRDGDIVIKYGATIWVCEREAFDTLYELPSDEEEAPLYVPPTVAAIVVGSIALCVCLALGSWFGSGVGWIVAAAAIFLMGGMGLFAGRRQREG